MWPKEKLSAIATRIGGGTPARDNKAYWGGEVPWFTVADLQDVNQIQSLTKGREGITALGLSCSAAKLVPAGAVVFSSRVVVGKVGIAKNDLATNQDFSSFVPTSRVDNEFLAYFLINAKNDLRVSQRGATIKGITTAVIDELEIPLPPKVEQRRIVSRIKACMERVEEIDALRYQAKREATAIEFASFHDSLVEGIDGKSWPVLKLGDVAKSFRYGTSTKTHTETHGLPVIRMGNLQGGYLDLSELKYVELPPAEAARYKLRVGDVLINRTNSLELVGKAATFGGAEGEWLYASYLVRVEVDRGRVLPEFVTSVINSAMGRDYVLRTARRAIGMVNLNAKEMAKFPMPVPSLEEQESIVARLMTARQLAEELRTSMAEPEIGFLRSSILKKAFAGEL